MNGHIFNFYRSKEHSLISYTEINSNNISLKLMDEKFENIFAYGQAVLELIQENWYHIKHLFMKTIHV